MEHFTNNKTKKETSDAEEPFIAASIDVWKSELSSKASYRELDVA